MGGGASALRTLHGLIHAAMVPSVPAKQALKLMLAEEDQESSHGESALGSTRVAAALGVALSSASATEWQLATSQLLPQLAPRLLSETTSEPPSAGGVGEEVNGRGMGDRQTEAPMRSQALALLHCLLVLCGDTSEAAERLSLAPNFALRLARWLGAISREASSPLTLALLLGVAMRASHALDHPLTRNRLFICCLQLQAALLEQAPPQRRGGTHGGTHGHVTGGLEVSAEAVEKPSDRQSDCSKDCSKDRLEWPEQKAVARTLWAVLHDPCCEPMDDEWRTTLLGRIEAFAGAPASQSP